MTDSLNSWLMSVPEGWVLFASVVGLAVLGGLVGLKASAEQLTSGDEKLAEQLKTTTGYAKPVLAFEMRAREALKTLSAARPDAKQVLRAAVVWDFLFIFIYSALITAVCLVGARYLDAQGYVGFRVSLFFILLTLFAAALDAAENCALLAVLADYPGDALPLVARWCAKVKFALLLYVAVPYALLACAAALVLWLYHSCVGRAAAAT